MKKIYVAGPNGFTAAGRAWHDEVLLPMLRVAGFDVLDPWTNPAADAFPAAFAIEDLETRIAELRKTNADVGRANAEMIEQCDAVLANLEGSDVDSGTAAEIGFAAAKGKLVIGFRDDFRMSGDNPGAVVNLQIEHFITLSGGSIESTAAAAIAALDRLTIGADIRL